MQPLQCEVLFKLQTGTSDRAYKADSKFKHVSES